MVIESHPLLGIIRKLGQNVQKITCLKTSKFNKIEKNYYARVQKRRESHEGKSGAWSFVLFEDVR